MPLFLFRGDGTAEPHAAADCERFIAAAGCERFIPTVTRALASVVVKIVGSRVSSISDRL